MEFHEKLKELRKQKELTQEALAEALYVSRTAISKWESGRGYPNIETLKSISSFFSVSIDDLLSSDELITAAEEDNRQKSRRIRDTVFGLLDCIILLFLILPILGVKIDGIVVNMSLFSLQGISLHLKVAYFSLVFVSALWGILMLLLQNSIYTFWLHIKIPVSLLLTILGVVLFIISSQVYCSCLLFVFLGIKAIILIKMP